MNFVIGFVKALLDCGTPVNRIFFLLFMSMSPIDGKFASRFLFELKSVLSTRVLAINFCLF